MNPETAKIRACGPEDMIALAELIRELAIYEKLEHHARATPETLREHLFGESRCAEALIAEAGGKPVGFALFFTTFSTFRGQPGLYLEDLFVRLEYRGQGIGKALLTQLARLAADRQCGRLEWAVLNWNQPAIGFYRSLGAFPLEEWSIYRLHDEPLQKLAAGSSPAPGRSGS
jgi:GNAT superfamily N-acetyltransferase